MLTQHSGRRSASLQCRTVSYFWMRQICSSQNAMWETWCGTHRDLFPVICKPSLNPVSPLLIMYTVSLRVLDYYDGVLFLTTNRVGTVDEVFRFRIHLSLYYPALRKKQALENFKLNIGRIVEFATSKAELRGKEEDGQSKLPVIEIDKDSILDFATRQWELTKNHPNRRVS